MRRGEAWWAELPSPRGRSISSRRFTRPTNGFSKRAENHAHAVALHFWRHNFSRKQATLKTTSAVAAGIASGR